MCVFVCIYIYIYVDIDRSMCKRVHTYIHINKCVCVCVCVRARARARVCVCVKNVELHGKKKCSIFFWLGNKWFFPYLKIECIKLKVYGKVYWKFKIMYIHICMVWTPYHGRAKSGRPTWTDIQQFRVDTGCSPGDLPKAMGDREAWQERVGNIRADSATWYIHIYKK